MDFITEVNGMQVEIPAEEVLRDKRFNWKERKVATMRLHDLYRKAGYKDYAARAADCSTFLQFNVHKSGERLLKTANFCKLRLCPLCIGRRAKRSAWKLSKILDEVEREHNVKYLFITLALKNVTDGAELGNGVDQLIKAWDRFLDQRQIRRTVRGWFRAIEITRGDGVRKKDKGYHPHIHAILAVDQDYFSRESRRNGKYLNQRDLIERWQRAARVDYRPTAQIETTKARRKSGGVESASLAAAKEAAKYPVKDDDYIDKDIPEDRAIEILRDYTEALRRRRLTAFGGWLKEAARKMDAENLEDGDLVHTDGDEIRPDLVVMVESYHWHFGAGDFILTDREINPLEC